MLHCARNVYRCLKNDRTRLQLLTENNENKKKEETVSITVSFFVAIFSKQCGISCHGFMHETCACAWIISHMDHLMHGSYQVKIQ